MPMRALDPTTRGNCCRLCGTQYDEVASHERQCTGSTEYNTWRADPKNKNRKAAGKHCDYCGDFKTRVEGHRIPGERTCHALKNPKRSQAISRGMKGEFLPGLEYLANVPKTGTCSWCEKPGFLHLHLHCRGCKDNPHRDALEACLHCGKQQVPLSMASHLSICKDNPHRDAPEHCVHCGAEQLPRYMASHLKKCRHNPEVLLPGQCRYCGDMVATRVYTHERSCAENSSNAMKSCQYCQASINLRGIGRHESHCQKNPDRSPTFCRYCHEDIGKSAASCRKHELFCDADPDIPRGQVQCICSDIFATYKKLYNHRHNHRDSGDAQCPLASVSWDEKTHCAPLMMKCTCDETFHSLPELRQHATQDCLFNRAIFKAKFPGTHRRRRGNRPPPSISPNIRDPVELQEASRKLLALIGNRKLDQALPGEWQRFLEAHVAHRQVYYLDTEGISSNARPFLVHVNIADATGTTVLNCLLDNGSFEELWMARTNYSGRMKRMYERLVIKYYGPNRDKMMDKIPKLKVQDLARKLKKMDLSHSVILKWSTAFFDWYALRRALSPIDKSHYLPPLEQMVRPPTAIKTMYRLRGVVSCGLEDLFALLFPKSKLNATHHTADVDVAKLFEVAQFFRQRTQHLPGSKLIAEITDEDEELLEEELYALMDDDEEDEEHEEHEEHEK